jgi:hypothetical protein
MTITNIETAQHCELQLSNKQETPVSDLIRNSSRPEGLIRDSSGIETGKISVRYNRSQC